MSLLSWLSDRFKRKTPVKKPTTTNNVVNPPIKKSNENNSTSSKIPVDSPKPLVIDSANKNELNLKTTTITYFFVDENDQIIQAPDRIVGAAGQRVHYQLPNINNYYFIGIDELVTTFPEKDTTVTISYIRTPGAPVQIYYLNYDTGQIMHPMQVINGSIGQNYQTKPLEFSGYRVIQSTGLTRGVFTSKTNQVVYFYRPQGWQTVQSVNQFIKLKSPTPVFSDIDGEQLPVDLPANIVLRVFTIVTNDQQQKWLNLGGSEWIKGSNNYKLVVITHTSEITSPDWQQESIKTSGVVDIAANTTVASYNRPNGQAIKNWNDQTPIKIISKVIDEQKVSWYQLTDQSYLPAIFVALDD